MFVQDPPKNSNNQADKDPGANKESDQNPNSPAKQPQKPPAQPSQNQPQQNQDQQQTEEKKSADYVNSYQPPKQGVKTEPDSEPQQQPKQAEQPKQPEQSQQPKQSQQAQQPEQSQQPKEPVSFSPPDTQQTDTQPAGDSQPNNQEENSEAIQRQNIFFLLGVEEGPSEEKERFLDELQQIVWEDFLENDLDLLITSQEKEKVDQIIANADLSDLDKQEKIVEYLETLMPVADLEEIMLEKALELKQEMVKERVEGMKEYFAGQEDKIAKINDAAQLFAQGKWHSGAELLNEMVETKEPAAEEQPQAGE